MALTIDQLRERPTLAVEEAGEALGLRRTSAYAAVKRGDIPTITIGRRRLVPTAHLLRMLGIEPAELQQRTALDTIAG